MQVMARAWGQNDFSQFNNNDVATLHKIMASLSGVEYWGIGKPD
jgi:hypothetical protein